MGAFAGGTAVVVVVVVVVVAVDEDDGVEKEEEEEKEEALEVFCFLCLLFFFFLSRLRFFVFDGAGMAENKEVDDLLLVDDFRMLVGADRGFTVDLLRI